VRKVEEVAAHFGLEPGDTVIAPALSDTPGWLGGAPPRLGEHTLEVMARVGEAGR
jgi:hypothetical protein